jgi:hypothetical protein
MSSDVDTVCEYITVVLSKLEDTKGVIRIRISKNIDNTMDK